MAKAEVTVYGAHWCPDCRRSKQFLGEHQIPYEWVDIEQDKEAEQFVIETNKGKRIIPTITVRGGEFKATQIIQEKVLSHPNIDVRWHTEVKEFIGEHSKLTKLQLQNNQTGAEEELSVNGAFIFIGLVPNTVFLQDTGILLDQWGFVVTGHALLHQKERPLGFENREPFFLETSIPGIFAAGDVRDKSTKQVVGAAGEGAGAALMIREYLKSI